MVYLSMQRVRSLNFAVFDCSDSVADCFVSRLMDKIPDPEDWIIVE